MGTKESTLERTVNRTVKSENTLVRLVYTTVMSGSTWEMTENTMVR